jgi:hypothetical protein
MEIQTKFLLSQVRRVRYERVYDTFNGGGKIQTKITPTGEKKWWIFFFSPMVVCNKFCITFISLNQFIMKNNVSPLTFREWEIHIRKQCINVEPIKHSEIKSEWRVNWCLYGKILECKKRS